MKSPYWILGILFVCLFIFPVAATVTKNETTDGAYTVIQWTSNLGTLYGGNYSDTTYWEPPVGVSEVEYLIVGGGGSGGKNNAGGGGGAGGMRNATGLAVSGNITIKVGLGGGSSSGGISYNGSPSSFGSLIAWGGGAGAHYDTNANGRPGGSGGGGGGTGTGGVGVAGQGNNGGAGMGAVAPYRGGGGGGAGSAGVQGSTNGNGGNGWISAITGVSRYYSGGGGGGSYQEIGGSGGLGGGGHGGSITPSAAPTNGTSGFYGGGGGGARYGTAEAGGGGSSGIVVVRYLTPGGSVSADFIQNLTEGFPGTVVNFTDTSTGDPTVFNWLIYHTGSSPVIPQHTTQNATILFSTGGNYTVNLTVAKPGSTSTKIGYMDIWNYTSGDFAANETTGIMPLAVKFTPTTFNATSWNWSFGDGNVSSDQSPEHLYEVIGAHDVKLYINNTKDSAWINKSGYITITAGPVPVTAFAGVPTSGTVPLNVSFTDSSTETPTAWNWSFGDGNLSTLQDPEYRYLAAGTYTVNLTATNGFGSDSEVKTNYITVSPLIASFSANATTGVKPLAIAFSGSSTGVIDEWYWEFGDGNTSAVQSPTFTYVNNGTYNVSLKVTNLTSGAHDFENKTAYITVTDTPNGFNQQDIELDPQFILTVTVTDSETGLPIPVVTITDSDGQTVTTTTGVGVLTEGYGLVTGTLIADGYYSRAFSVVVDEDMARTYQMTPASDTVNPSIVYIPQQVRFRFVGIDGYPVSGMLITATPLNFTAPSNWTEILFGINPAVNITGSAVNGITGDDGSWVAPMLSSIQYSIHMLRSDIDYTITLYPSQTEYTFTIPIGVIAIPTPASNVVSYSIQNASVDATHQYFNMSYLDASGGTNALTFSVRNTSGIVLSSASYSGAAANNQVFSQLVTVSQGESYTFAFAANQSEYGWINQTDTVTLANQIALLDAAPGWVEEWIAIALIIVIASIFTLWSKPFALVGIPVAGWFFQHILGWLPSTFMSDIAFVCMLALGILVYIRQKENAIQ